MTTPLKAPAEWSVLLADAVSTPGFISSAYTRFWNYSVGNQLLAQWQCRLRGIPPGPINTYLGWKDLGRNVRKGEKALILCMPIQIKAKDEDQDESGDDPSTKEGRTFKRFLYRANWFTLSQTDGEPYVPQELPSWSEERAMPVLGISRVSFEHSDGNVQGYALGKSVSISPVAFLPHRTLFHELAHVVLGHTEESQQIDAPHTPRSLREVEADSVALICCESLGLPGSEYCRGYIQHWLKSEKIPERSAHKIFKAADQILRSGRADTSNAQPAV